MEQGMTKMFLRGIIIVSSYLRLCAYGLFWYSKQYRECMTAWDSHIRIDKSIIHKSSDFRTSLLCLCFFSVFFFYRAQKNRKYVVWFTSTSRKSWSFLHVAEKVSEVPNSKYHSLFFVLKKTRQQELQRGQEKRKHRSVFPTSKSKACTVIASLLLSLSSPLYTELMKKKKKQRTTL